MKRFSDAILLRSHEKGLSLIEVVISMAIFAIGFLAIAGLMVATARNNTTGNTLTHATLLAEAKVEYLKALPLDQLANACLDQNEPEIIDQIFTRECEVKPLGSTHTIKSINVTVRWKKSGNQRHVVLQTNTRGMGK